MYLILQNLILPNVSFVFMKLSFQDIVFPESGISVSSDKVKAVLELTKPMDKNLMQRVLGLLNYLSKCNPNYADITAPLRYLLNDYVVFIWNACQEQVFRQP